MVHTRTSTKIYEHTRTRAQAHTTMRTVTRAVHSVSHTVLSTNHCGNHDAPPWDRGGGISTPNTRSFLTPVPSARVVYVLCTGFRTTGVRDIAQTRVHALGTASHVLGCDRECAKLTANPRDARDPASSNGTCMHRHPQRRKAPANDHRQPPAYFIPGGHFVSLGRPSFAPCTAVAFQPPLKPPRPLEHPPPPPAPPLPLRPLDGLPTGFSPHLAERNNLSYFRSTAAIKAPPATGNVLRTGKTPVKTREKQPLIIRRFES